MVNGNLDIAAGGLLTFTAVPEPATLVLVAAAAGLSLAARQRKKPLASCPRNL